MAAGPTPKGPIRAASQQKKAAFLAALRETGEVAEACERAGISRRTPYLWAEKSEAGDRTFAEAFERARRIGERALLAEVRQEVKRRAFGSKGKSDILLMFYAKRLDPAFKDNVLFNVTAAGPLAISLSLDDSPRPQLPAGPQAPALSAVSGDEDPDAPGRVR